MSARHGDGQPPTGCIAKRCPVSKKRKEPARKRPKPSRRGLHKLEDDGLAKQVRVLLENSPIVAGLRTEADLDAIGNPFSVAFSDGGCAVATDTVDSTWSVRACTASATLEHCWTTASRLSEDQASWGGDRGAARVHFKSDVAKPAEETTPLESLSTKASDEAGPVGDSASRLSQTPRQALRRARSIPPTFETIVTSEWQQVSRAALWRSQSTPLTVVPSILQADETSSLSSSLRVDMRRNGLNVSAMSKKRAQPQKKLAAPEGEIVWPEHWGLTSPQLRIFLNSCREDPRWRETFTMRDVVERYVKPKTAGTGMGYALLANLAHPKEVSIMVSHSWNENFRSFVEAIERSVEPDEGLFICAFSIFQNGDHSGPSISEQIGVLAFESPFYRALANIRDRGIATPCQWFWARYYWPLAVLLVAFGGMLNALSLRVVDCPISGNVAFCESEGEASDTYRLLKSVLQVTACICFALAVPAWHAPHIWRMYRGRMLVVPNSEDDIYSRLWCVYEIFVAHHLGVPIERAENLAPVGNMSCRHANCSSPEDSRRIRAEIEVVGYDAIDATIRRVKRMVMWKSYQTSMTIVVMLIIDLLIANSPRWDDIHWSDGRDHYVEDFSAKITELALSSVLANVFVRYHGEVHTFHVLMINALTTLVSAICFAVKEMAHTKVDSHDWQSMGAVSQGVLQAIAQLSFVNCLVTSLLTVFPKTGWKLIPRIVFFAILVKDLLLVQIFVPSEYREAYVVENFMGAVFWYQCCSFATRFGLKRHYLKNMHMVMALFVAHYFVVLCCVWHRVNSAGPWSIFFFV